MGEENSSWVVSFVQTEFFHGCRNHKFKDRKYYCYNCLEEEALCEECATQYHKCLGHLVLQVRKTSHRDSIHVDDIKNLGVDLSCIQQLSINNHLAVYLRPNAKNGCNKSTGSSCIQNGININGSSKCDTCGSIITKVGSKFCSLACKVTNSSCSSSSSGRRRNTNDISSVDPTTLLLVDQKFSNGRRRRRIVIDDDAQSKRKRRRKQKLSRRAPFL